MWTIALDSIAVERWDASDASWNAVVADHSEFSVDDYVPETGIELLSCPHCRTTDRLEVTGQWGGPLTYACPGGHTTVGEVHEDPRLNWGSNLLVRLILTEADPASRARTLLQMLTECRDSEHQRQRDPWYNGPDKRDAQIAENTDLTDSDLAQALHAGIGIRLPHRHAGRKLELLLVHSALAIATPAIRDTDDGRALDAAIRALLDDIRTEWQRMAPARVLVREQLRAWRDEGGPQVWQASWDRTLQLVGASLGGYVMGQEEGSRRPPPRSRPPSTSRPPRTLRPQPTSPRSKSSNWPLFISTPAKSRRSGRPDCGIWGTILRTRPTPWHGCGGACGSITPRQNRLALPYMSRGAGPLSPTGSESPSRPTTTSFLAPWRRRRSQICSRTTTCGRAGERP